MPSDDGQRAGQAPATAPFERPAHSAGIYRNHPHLASSKKLINLQKNNQRNFSNNSREKTEKGTLDKKKRFVRPATVRHTPLTKGTLLHPKFFVNS